MPIFLSSIVAALLCIRGTHAVGTAFGYASGTTGGGSAAAAVPTSTSQLVSWLGDSTARTILLDKIFDFTDTEGSTTGTACAPWTCTPNPQLAINQNSWCDNYYPSATKIQNIGRQMIVTGYGSAQKVTISDNVFEGSGTYSATCNGRHYWALYFTGAADTITFARNYIYMTSGGGPKIGGTSGYTQLVHMYNNYYVSVAGHALDAGTGAKVIMEGNYFNTVTTPSVSGTAGAVYAAIDSSTASTCSSYLGRSCYANTLLSSGGLSETDTSALSAFSSVSAVRSASIMAASSVSAYVQANAGLGIVN
ncbi:hypothetical protein RSAG8_05131, partial [Rhizoctonia solani AG-8 WAC10335]